MPASRRTLVQLRRYQQLLMFGGGITLTILTVLAFAIDSVSTVHNKIIEERQAWLADRSLVVCDISESEASFRNALISTEFLWNEGHLAPDSLVDKFIAQQGEVVVQPFDTLRPQFEISLPGVQPSTDAIRRALGLSLQLARVNAASSLLRGRATGVYRYSVDGQFLAVLPLQMVSNQQLRARLADRATLKQIMAVDLRDLPGPASNAAAGLLGAPRAVRWLEPAIDPLTDLRSVRIAALAYHDGKPFEVLVMQYTAESLLAPLDVDDYEGTFMIISRTREVIAAASQTETSSELIERVRHAKTLNLYADAPREQFHNSMMTFSAPLGDTGWTLVYALPWRSIAASVAVQLGTVGATTVVILIVLWLLIVILHRRVFVPAFERSAQVFESEHLSRTLIETAPVGLGLISTGPRKPLLRSPVMSDMDLRVLVDAPTLSAELVRRYVANLEQHTDADSEHRVVYEDIKLPVRDGGYVDLAVSLAPARYQGEDVLVTAFSDVTEKRQLEQQLREAKQAADSANAAKSAFLAAMSHEIRTPLNAILGNLELFAHSRLDALQRDRLSTIRTSSEGLLAIISDILDFSKIEAGEMTLEYITFNIVELVEHALTIFAPLARAKHLELHAVLCASAAQTMHGDPGRVAQIVHNLLSNAIKFTERGEVTLSLSVETALGREPLLKLVIEDTGIGMFDGQQQSIFHAFAQADTTINQRFGGTGLGLALCRRLLDSMHGTIEVDSEAGCGSRFTVYLPLCAEPVGDVVWFDNQRVILLAAAGAWRASLVSHLEAWKLRVDACAHPALIDEAMLDNAAALILFGSRETWLAEEENRLVEAADWVIDCRDGGPSMPVLTGRLFDLSCFSLSGLKAALRQALTGGEAQPSEYAYARSPVAVAAADGRTLRVLVAEDNAVNGKLFAEQLQMLSCDPTVVESGKAVLDVLDAPEGQEMRRASDQPPDNLWDVLLTDLHMPGMSGYALAEAVLARRPTLPIVAVTAHATDHERARCRALGIAYVAIKPLSLAQLRDLLIKTTGARALEMSHLPSGSAGTAAGMLGGNAIPTELHETFVASCAKSLADLRAARKTNDVDQVMVTLHGLTGMLSVFGYASLAAHSRRLEDQIRASTSLATQKADLDTIESALIKLV